MPAVRRRAPPSTSSGALGVVRAPLVSEHVADLADGAAGAEGIPHRREEILRTAGHPADLGERVLGCGCVAPGPDARRPLELAPLDLRIEVVKLDLLALGLLEAVDADDDPLAALDLLRVAVRGLLDLALDEPGLDGGDRAAELLHPIDQLQRPRLELSGQLLDVERAAERVGGVGPAGLVLKD